MGFVGKVLAGGSQHPVVSTLYGVCGTAATTAAKVVSIGDVDTLITGMTIHVKMQYSNTAAAPTLNVNSTGALPIYTNATQAPGKTRLTSWTANSVLSLTYDGTAWRMNDCGLNASTAMDDLKDELKSYFLNQIYPVGSIYMSTSSTSPADRIGGTWQRIEGRFLLAATDGGESGAAQKAGNMGGAATVTLTENQIPAHRHEVPSHSHGLNSHTHTVPAHKHGLGGHTHGLNSHVHGLNSHTHGLGSHTHSIPALSGTAVSAGAHTHKANDWVVGAAKNMLKHLMFGFTASNAENDHAALNYIRSGGWGNDDDYAGSSAGAHTHSVTTSEGTTGAASGDTGAASGNTGAASGNTAAATGNTADSIQLTSGTPSVSSTAAQAAFNTEAAGGGTAHTNMPPYLSVYVWKRIQ